MENEENFNTSNVTIQPYHLPSAIVCHTDFNTSNVTIQRYTHTF